MINNNNHNNNNNNNNKQIEGLRKSLHSLRVEVPESLHDKIYFYPSEFKIKVKSVFLWQMYADIVPTSSDCGTVLLVST